MWTFQTARTAFRVCFWAGRRKEKWFRRSFWEFIAKINFYSPHWSWSKLETPGFYIPIPSWLVSIKKDGWRWFPPETDYSPKDWARKMTPKLRPLLQRKVPTFIRSERGASIVAYILWDIQGTTIRAQTRVSIDPVTKPCEPKTAYKASDFANFNGSYCANH